MLPLVCHSEMSKLLSDWELVRLKAVIVLREKKKTGRRLV